MPFFSQYFLQSDFVKVSSKTTFCRFTVVFQEIYPKTCVLLIFLLDWWPFFRFLVSCLFSYYPRPCCGVVLIKSIFPHIPKPHVQLDILSVHWVFIPFWSSDSRRKFKGSSRKSFEYFDYWVISLKKNYWHTKEGRTLLENYKKYSVVKVFFFFSLF